MKTKRTTAILLAALMLAAMSGTAIADTGYSKYATLTILGRGRAHGVGLCMTSVKNMALARYRYSQILPYFYRRTRVQYKTNIAQTVRVGVYSRRTGGIAVKPGAGSYYSVRAGSRRILFKGGAGKMVSVWRSRGRYVVRMKQGSRVLGTRYSTAPVRVYAGRGTILKIANDGRMYRGHVEVRWGASSRRLWAVNIVAIEYYLRGLGEEPDSWPYEGLKVLAVVSRSYAAYRAAHPKHGGDGFAICNTGDCQAYVGYNYERQAPRLRSAVRGTAHRVVTYAGRLVVTPYFSNSGGQTENIEYVWGGSPKPWLKSVRTRWAKPHAAYSWRLRLSFNSMTARLAQSSATSVRGSLSGLRVLLRGVSPRVRRMAVDGSGGTKYITGGQFQNVAALQSTWFYFDLPPRMRYATYTSSFSPNDDGVVDSAAVGYTLSEAAEANFVVYNSGGTAIYRSGTWSQSAGRRYVYWNGKDSGGRVLPSGRYRIVVFTQDARSNRNYVAVWVTLQS